MDLGGPRCEEIGSPVSCAAGIGGGVLVYLFDRRNTILPKKAIRILYKMRDEIRTHLKTVIAGPGFLNEFQ